MFRGVFYLVLLLAFSPVWAGGACVQSYAKFSTASFRSLLENPQQALLRKQLQEEWSAAWHKWGKNRRLSTRSLAKSNLAIQAIGSKKIAEQKLLLFRAISDSNHLETTNGGELFSFSRLLVGDNPQKITFRNIRKLSENPSRAENLQELANWHTSNANDPANPFFSRTPFLSASTNPEQALSYKFDKILVLKVDPERILIPNTTNSVLDQEALLFLGAFPGEIVSVVEKKNFASVKDLAQHLSKIKKTDVNSARLVKLQALLTKQRSTEILEKVVNPLLVNGVDPRFIEKEIRPYVRRNMREAEINALREKIFSKWAKHNKLKRSLWYESGEEF